MELEKYADVHPRWEVIEGLSERAARGTLRLLLTGVYLDDQLDRDELQALAETWQRLPFVGPYYSEQKLFELLARTHDQLDDMRADPGIFNSFVEGIADEFRDEEVAIAVLRLLAIVLTEDGTKEEEQGLMYAFGHHAGLAVDTIDDVVRSVWESHEESASTSTGKRRKKPVLKGKHWARERPSQPYANPFNTPLN
ncbi:MAG: hypothetical protein ACOCV2_01420 [Persicimonas sp.]